MSRIGRQPITLPAGVTVTHGDGRVTATGPRGSLSKPLHQNMIVKVEGSVLTVERPDDEKLNRSLHGLTRTIIANMVEGVSNGYARTLDVVGVGYRTALNAGNLSLAVGLSHGIEIPPRPGITFEVGIEGQSRTPFLTIRGIDKELVGQVAAQIRAIRPPEPYKGKGIRYRGEQVRRKAGKSAKAGGKGGKK